MEAFYIYNNSFNQFTKEHVVSFLVCILLGFILLYYGRYKWNKEEKHKYIVCFIIFYLFTQWAEPFLKNKFGEFKLEEDLPLHLCNITPLFIFLVMYFKNRTWFGIFFFWIMCASAQALFTPTHDQSFPHFESIRYWAVHAGLTFTALYGSICYRWKLTYRDVINSFIVMNIGAGIIHLINLSLNSNYWFTRAKPASPTFYDLLGDWPTYMLQLEPITIGLFSVMYFIVKVVSRLKIGGLEGVE